ncbi:hypothetical protein [Ferrimonas lipolytica]|uniref:Uncharacterized protein n=1 Tax=Ferrimonas lipolytica TaxID=2724191 RepID=A0A6H1UG89_9GAMM|nr:hypothetical protein [Ferrimonas lipolytica]QIZ77620.1 hypothetical protein HER31_12385 [Ferrimonas lipolytica]
MSVTAVPLLAKPELKSHHKARHQKKYGIGAYAETCVEFRFEADIEKFDDLDDALTELQGTEGWDLFIAFFSKKYHVAVSFYTAQESQDEVIAKIQGVIKAQLGEVATTILAGDANYGDWDGSYAE